MDRIELSALIAKANDYIQTTNIQGKEYAEVNQRIAAFRGVFPGGFITTEMISNVDGVCIFRATAGYYAEDGQPVILGTGTAYEKEGSSYINRTSYIENCETSAVGRALGMCGFGIAASLSSAEEVQNAQLQQNDLKAIGAVKAKALGKRCKDEGVDVTKLVALYKVASLAELNEKQHSNIVNNWQKVLEVCR